MTTLPCLDVLAPPKTVITMLILLEPLLANPSVTLVLWSYLLPDPAPPPTPLPLPTSSPIPNLPRNRRNLVLVTTCKNKAPL